MEGPTRFFTVCIILIFLVGSAILAARATCTTDGWRCLDQGSIVNGGKMK